MSEKVLDGQSDAPAGADLAQRSLSEKLADQGELFWGALKQAPASFKTAGQEALANPGNTALMTAASFGLGAAVAVLSKRPELLGQTMKPLVETTLHNGGKVLSGTALVDLTGKTVAPSYAVWKDPSRLESSQALLGSRLGRGAFDYGLNLGSGAAGFYAVSRLGRHAGLHPTAIGEGFEGLQRKGLLLEQLPASVKAENFLGRGGNGAVYKLDFTDDFVVKVPEFKTKTPVLGSLEKVDDIMPGANIGQPVAKMGDYLILKKQNGFPAGSPDARSRRAMSAEAAEAVYARSIKESANLPQSAYDELALLMMKLEKRGLQFDPSKPGNILIDPASKRFNLVDISPTSAVRPHKHTVSDMIVPLMDNYFTGSILADKGLKYRPQLAQIISKATKAARSASMHPAHEGDSSLRYSYQLAGLKPP